MKYIEFKSKLSAMPVFSRSDIRQVEPKFSGVQLVNWQRSGYIQKLVRNYYMFSDTEVTDEFLFYCASQFYDPAYLSFESALHYYSFIPEQPYTITSASTRKTQTLRTPIATFQYHKLKASAFFGYTLQSFSETMFKVASPEKALLDYLYRETDIQSVDDIAARRLNAWQISDLIDLDLLWRYANRFGNKALLKRCDVLVDYLESAQ